MPSISEQLFYAFINHVPYTLLALYPFQNTLRFGKKRTLALFFLYSLFCISLFTAAFQLGSIYLHIASQIITILSIIFYFFTVKSRWGRMLFHLFMIKNIADFVVVCAKFLEGSFFPDSIGTTYYWTDSFCMLLVMIPLTPIIIYIIHHYFTQEIRNSIDPTLWQYLWLIPLFFYVIWMYIFYFSSTESSLELALKPKSFVFMIFFLSGQLLIYICIAKLVILFNKSALLEEENQHLASQALQYRNIQNRIQEISAIKHDMRHHLVTLYNYSEHENYEELKHYLRSYMSALPDSKISYCSNITLNMLLVYYMQKCRKAHVSFDIHLNVPENLVLSDSDITVMFGNLLENALEACCTVYEQPRYIRLSGKYMQKQIIFVVENSYENVIKKDSAGRIYSSKHSGYGIGNLSVRKIINRNNGTFQLSTKDGNFSIAIFLPAPSSDS